MIKTFNPARDIKEQPSEVSEVNIYGGSIFSGAVDGTAEEASIKKFSHWTSGSNTGSFYHALYSTHHTSSTAIELATVTFGFSISSSYYSNVETTNKEEKNRIYKLYSKIFNGSEDERFSIGGTIRDELIFLHFKRSQRKDELKKESVTLTTIFSGAGAGGGNESVFSEYVFSDAGAASTYTKGAYGDTALLYSGSVVGGLVNYQAGLLVLVPEMVSCTSSLATNPGNTWSGSLSYGQMVVSGGSGGTYDQTIDAMRYRIRNISLINVTNLHSTLYFCRALNDEFNYSSNPTFLDSDKRIIITSGSNNLTTRTYMTKVGLTGENDELLAVASISQPLKKSPDTERTIIVRLDY